jgi:endonuclease/exonuclease/phosphatase family metal-dependent hydrolase
LVFNKLISLLKVSAEEGFFIMSVNKTKGETLTVLVYNVNTDPRIHKDKGYAFSSHNEWTFEKRADSVYSSIEYALEHKSVDIIHLQELAKYTVNGKEVNSLDSMTSFLDKYNYTYTTQKVKPTFHEYSIQYVSAFKKDRFSIVSQDAFYFTKNPYHLRGSPAASAEDECDYSYGENAQRSALVTKLHDNKANKKVFSINVHIGYDLSHRIQSSKIIVDYINKEIESSKELQQENHFIVAGDFNTFSGPGQNESIDILTKSGKMTDVSTDIHSNGTLMEDPSTFFAFPFDCITEDKNIQKQISDPSISKNQRDSIFYEHCKVKAGQLDHILVSENLTKLGDAELILRPEFTPLPKNYSENGLKEYIAEHSFGIDGKPVFASDHQPLLATVAYVDYVDHL